MTAEAGVWEATSARLTSAGAKMGLAEADGVCKRVTVSETASEATPPPTVPKHTHRTTLLSNDVAPAAVATPEVATPAATPVNANARCLDACGT
jgi:hypothetical protein